MCQSILSTIDKGKGNLIGKTTGKASAGVPNSSKERIG
jgi:hypothetical protein